MLVDYSGEKTYQEKRARISSKVNILIFNFSAIIRLARKFLSSETRNTTHTARSINSHTLLVETSTSFYSNTTYLFFCFSNYMRSGITEKEMFIVRRNLYGNANITQSKIIQQYDACMTDTFSPIFFCQINYGNIRKLFSGTIRTPPIY